MRRIKLKMPCRKENIEKSEKRFVSGLDFHRIGDKLVSGTDFRVIPESSSELISPVVSAKISVKRPSFKFCFLLSNRNNPASNHSVTVSCWASLCRFESRFLVGLTDVRMEKTSGFLCLNVSSALESNYNNVHIGVI